MPQSPAPSAPVAETIVQKNPLVLKTVTLEAEGSSDSIVETPVAPISLTEDVEEVPLSPPRERRERRFSDAGADGESARKAERGTSKAAGPQRTAVKNSLSSIVAEPLSEAAPQTPETKRPPPPSANKPSSEPSPSYGWGAFASIKAWTGAVAAPASPAPAEESKKEAKPEPPKPQPKQETRTAASPRGQTFWGAVSSYATAAASAISEDLEIKVRMDDCLELYRFVFDFFFFSAKSSGFTRAAEISCSRSQRAECKSPCTSCCGGSKRTSSWYLFRCASFSGWSCAAARSDSC